MEDEAPEITLYAQWDRSYSIKASIIGSEHGSLEIDKKLAKPGEEVNVLISPKEGYIIKLFTIKDEKSNNLIHSGSGTDSPNFNMINSGVIVEVEFVEMPAGEKTVIFDANGGKFVSESVEEKIILEVKVQGGEKVEHIENIEKAADEETFYYKFEGWYLDKEYVEEYNFDTAVTEDMELYAKWNGIREVLIEFDGNLEESELENEDGSLDTNNEEFKNSIPEQQIIKKGDKIKSVEDLAYIGEPFYIYNFLGWTTERIGEVLKYWDFESNLVEDNLEHIDKESETPTLTLYGQWDKVDVFTTGTEGHPYSIESIVALETLAERVNLGKTYEKCYFQLAMNLDLSSIENWTPIGSNNNPFKGNFTGGNESNYYEISNLNIDGKNDYQGLFGNFEGEYIKI